MRRPLKHGTTVAQSARLSNTPPAELGSIKATKSPRANKNIARWHHVAELQLESEVLRETALELPAEA